MAVAVGFWVLGSLVVTLRERIVRHRPDDYLHENLVSRVDFIYVDTQREAVLRQVARESAPRAYREAAESFDELERALLQLPEQASRVPPEQLPPAMRFDAGTLAALKNVHTERRDAWQGWVRGYAETLREHRRKGGLVILAAEDYQLEKRALTRTALRIYGNDGSVLSLLKGEAYCAPGPGTESYRPNLVNFFGPLATAAFPPTLDNAVASNTADTIGPTHVVHRDLTSTAQVEAEKRANLADASRPIYRNESILVGQGEFVTAAHWPLLLAEQRAYRAQLGWSGRFTQYLGMSGVVLLVTLALGVYTLMYQPRVATNYVRGIALAALLLGMLLVSHIAATGSWPVLLFGVAPTLLAAMILAIAYDRRYALGVTTLLAILTSVSLGQSAGFFLITWLGILAICFFLDEVRTRAKLVEVGGLSSVAMIAAAAALGAASNEPLSVIWRNALFAGAAGLGVGFVVLGVLDFIERHFRITTGLTLLEYGDVRLPLLRRLAEEASGTYSHSLQVAALSEAAAEAIGANSLLCRVGAYYHDIGKLRKPEYFAENQVAGENRHINLNPNVSRAIIIAHVLDGIEIAKEHHLPPALIPIIQQHHGTTVVEYFYHQAVRQAESCDGAEVSDAQYRYPGPKPRTREAALVMIADVVESATRSLADPTPARLTELVRCLTMKRLEDGQFDECDLTFAELLQAQQAIIRALLAHHHTRPAYPSAQQPESEPGAAKSA